MRARIKRSEGVGSVFRATTALSLASLIAGGLFAATTAVLARLQTPADLGRLLALYALAVLIADLGDLGTASRLVLRAQEGFLRSDFRLLLGARLFTQGCLLVALLAAGMLLHQQGLLAAFGALSLLTSLRAVQQASLRASRAYVSSAVAIVGERVLTLTAVVLVEPSRLTASMWCLLIGPGVVALLMVGPTGRPRLNLRSSLDYYWASRHLAVANSGSNLVLLEVPLLGIFAGSTVAGLYSLTARLVGPLAAIGSALGSVLLRELSADAEQQRRRRVHRAAAACYGAGVTISVPVLLWTEQLLAAVVGPDYVGAAGAFRWSVFTATVVAASQPVISALQVGGRSLTVAKVTAVSVFCYLTGVVLGGSIFGPTGAAAAAFISQAGTHAVLWGLLISSPDKEIGVPLAPR